VVGAEALMINWAGVNGITVAPAIRELDVPSGDLPVTRKTWSKPGAQPVTLYRVNGGGHGWPGGPQFPPARVIGPVSRHLDATGLLLDMAKRETASAAGRPMLNLGDLA
jgi:polyhydroxybutyrate depolymerase